MKKNLVWIFAIAFSIIAFSINKDLGIFLVSFLTVIISFIIERKRMWVWITSILVSWTWVYLGRQQYDAYEAFSFNILGISIFPIIAWPTGLVIFYFLVSPLFFKEKWIFSWLKSSVIYSIGIITVEYIGYNILGIHLESGKAFPGWKILNIFHCPWWMQLAYFLVGIIFFGITLFLEKKIKAFKIK